MLGVVVEDPVVDLVREDHEVVPAGDLDDAGQRLAAVDRSGRVVRINDYYCPGPGGDLACDVVEVGHPVGGLVAHVVDGPAAAQTDDRGPQRVVRCRQQHLVAVVEQRLQGHHDQF